MSSSDRSNDSKKPLVTNRESRLITLELELQSAEHLLSVVPLTPEERHHYEQVKQDILDQIFELQVL